jgi:upstream activation factor subunit UAF30
MAKGKSSKVESEVVPAVVAPVASIVEGEVVPKTKKPRVPKTVAPAPVATEPAPVVPAPVVQEPVVSEPVVQEPVAEVVDQQSVEFATKLKQISDLISGLKNEYKLLEKKWSKDLKIAQKQSSKRKRKSGNRAPSGFVKPTKISNELAIFLDRPFDSEMARTQVTREINNYIVTHDLKDKVNGRKIIPDKKLSDLLKITETDELTYFNLQKYMSPHFYKASSTVPLPGATV